MKTMNPFKKAVAGIMSAITALTVAASGVGSAPIQASAASNSPRIEVQVHCHINHMKTSLLNHKYTTTHSPAIIKRCYLLITALCYIGIFDYGYVCQII